jgi:hypothetical protein
LARSGESRDSRYAETRKNIKFSSSAPVKCDSEGSSGMSILKDSMQIDIQSSQCQNEAPVGTVMEIRWKSGHMIPSVKGSPPSCIYKVVSLDPYFTLRSSFIFETSENIEL